MIKSVRTLAFVALATAGASAPAQSYTSLFRMPVQIPSTLVNTSSQDIAPALTDDGLKLYFASNRVSSNAGSCVWSVTRTDLTAAWGNLTEEVGLNSTGNEDYLDVQGDDLEAFIASSRAGGQGLNDIWYFSRATPTAPWSTGVSLSINSASSEDDPTVTADGLELYWVAPDSASAGAIYWATRPSKGSTSWTVQGALPAAISTNIDHSPAISPDGLALIWSSDRPGGLGSSDMWMITRESRTAAWSAPVNLQELNTTGWEQNGQWGPDGFAFYFTQNSAGMITEARRIRPLTLVEGPGVLGVQNGVTGVRIGTTMNVSCRHDPGALGQIFLTTGKLPAPLAIPGVTGGLEVNLGTLIFPVGGTTGALSVVDGRYRLFPIAIPNVGPLAGFSFFAQTGVQSGALIALSTLTQVQLTP